MILSFLVILPTFGLNRRRFVDNGQLRRHCNLPFNHAFFAQNCLVLAQKLLKKYLSWFFVILVMIQAEWRRFVVSDIATTPIHYLEIFVMISIHLSCINIKNSKNIILHHKGQLGPDSAVNGIVSYEFLNTAMSVIYM